MIQVRLICVGKLREKHYIAAYEEYVKRLGAYCAFEAMELTEQRLADKPSAKEIEQALKREGEDILKNIQHGAYVTAMCVEGVGMSSEELASHISTRVNGGTSRFCYIVGGSNGLSEEVKRRADMKLSMSKMTFPHHLARVMLTEQVYRAFSINGGSKYHK